MKMTRTIIVSMAAVLTGIAVCTILLLLTAICPSAMCADGNCGALIRLLCTILIFLLVIGATLFFFIRRVLIPMREMRDFSAAIAKGEKPQPLNVGYCVSNEMQSLFRNLNVIRDRMQNLETKLSRNLAIELKSQHQREHLNHLKNEFFRDLLPGICRSASVIKGQLLIGEMRNHENFPENDDMLKKSIARIDAVSRDLEKLADIYRIRWERWNAPRNDKFDTSELIHDLLENDRLNSRNRDIKIVSRVSGELPVRLCIDRELLFQLLSLLTRSACRLAEPGSEILFDCGRDNRDEAVFEIAFSCKIAAFIAENEISIEDRQLKYGDGIISGLQIVKSCAGLIGCMLKITSPGDGKAAFTLSLPTGSSTYSAGSFSALPNHPFFPARTSGSDKKINIILWDDDADSSEVISTLLAGHGVATTVATNMDSCGELLGANNFDAVLVTAFSGTADPEKTIRKLRGFSKGKMLPIVIAASVLAENTRRQIEYFENCYLMPVPLNYRLLAEVLHRVRS